MSREEEKFEELRRKAEELLDHSSEDTGLQSKNFMELLHELKVHQKELEIRNDELRETQDELSALYSEYSDLYEFAPVAFITLSPKGMIRRINLSGVKLLGKERQLLTRAALITFVAKESAGTYYRSLKQAEEEGGPVRSQIELRPTRPKESSLAESTPQELWVQMDVIADREESGAPQQWRLALTDISDRVRAERDARELLREKEQLLREVHHRIKNHMYSINSIISYQSSQQESPEAREALEGIRSRVLVMQSIYDLLFSEASQGRIYLPAYIGKLLRYLREAYVQHDSVQIHSDIAELEVSARQSFPLGIIVNEGVVNALKYAFHGREAGHIWVTIQQIEQRKLRLRVADDGPGIDESEMAEERYGFGLTLIRGYAHQLDGGLQLGRSEHGGTELQVTLRLGK